MWARPLPHPRQQFGPFTCHCPRCSVDEGAPADPPTGEHLLTAFQCPSCGRARARLGGECAGCGASCDPGALDPLYQAEELLGQVDFRHSTEMRNQERTADMCASFVREQKWLHPMHHIMCALDAWLVVAASVGAVSPLALAAADRLIHRLETVLAMPWSDSPESLADPAPQVEAGGPFSLEFARSGTPAVTVKQLCRLYELKSSLAQDQEEQRIAAARAAALRRVQDVVKEGMPI